MTSASLVRAAVPQDEESLMDLCRLLHAENAAFSANYTKVRAMLHRAFAKQGATIGVIGPVGQVEAAIILLISSYWYTDDIHFEELFNFVHPEHRKSHHAKSLLYFAKKCSDEIGPPLNIGVMTGKQTAPKLNLYRKVFGYPIGAFFLYNNPWAKAEVTPNDDGAIFWDQPFPRPGVKVLSTAQMTQADRDALSVICKRSAA